MLNPFKQRTLTCARSALQFASSNNHHPGISGVDSVDSTLLSLLVKYTGNLLACSRMNRVKLIRAAQLLHDDPFSLHLAIAHLDSGSLT